MDVQPQPVAAPRLDGASDTPPTPAPAGSGRLSGERVGVALGAWQAAELRLARAFGECRGLSVEQLEDLYQDTTLALLGRAFDSEEHLRNALRWGIRHRALRMHRNERRRSEILGRHAGELQHAIEQREGAHTVEDAAVLDGDRLIVSEFLTELDELERRVFWLNAEGLRQRSIAPIVGVSVNEARKALRSCERKRERFQILYESGRLCGYRAQTITAIKEGQAVTAELAQRAYTHLQACAACRTQHKGSARRLKAAFQAQAAALAPLGLLAGRLPLLTRLRLRGQNLPKRLIPHTLRRAGGGVLRERAATLLASGGAAGKLAAGVATLAVIAGGTIGATGVLQHRATRPPAAHTPQPPASAESNSPHSDSAAAIAGAALSMSSHQAPATARAEHTRQTSHQREPGGFAYLGVPSQASQPSQEASVATTQPVRPPQPPAAQRAPEGEEQRGGGPFTP